MTRRRHTWNAALLAALLAGVVAGCGRADDDACPTCVPADGAVLLEPGDAGAPSFAAVCEAVTQLRAIASSLTNVTFAWRGGAGVSTTIMRKTYCGTDDYVTLANLGPGVAVYSDDAVQSDYVYWYALTASDARGNVATAVVALWANTDATAVGCSGNTPPQPSGVVPAAACAGLDF